MSVPGSFLSSALALEAAMAAGGLLRFVVLHHTGVPEPHFDLLIELPGWEKLLAWRVTSPPPAEWGLGGEEPLMARRIQDHRTAYLAYEGEISGGRGVVKRVMEGRAQILSVTEQMLRIREQKEGRWELGLPMEGTG